MINELQDRLVKILKKPQVIVKTKQYDKHVGQAKIKNMLNYISEI